MRSKMMKLTALVVAACIVISGGNDAGAVAKSKSVTKAASNAAGIVSQIRETLEASGRKASIKMTDIQATGVAASENGYADIFYERVYKYDKPIGEDTSVLRGQRALINKNGEIVIPYSFGAQKRYACYNGIISHANDSQTYGFSFDVAYDGVQDLCRYYDTNLNELFAFGNPDTGTAWKDGIIASPVQLFDTKGNLTYEVPADLQKASIWNEYEVTSNHISGLPDVKTHVVERLISLGASGDEGLVPFGSAITMNGKIELPDLKGTKWDTENGIDYLGYFKENAVRDGKLCGYVDASGKIVIPQSYYECGQFIDGLAWVASPEGVEVENEFSENNAYGLFSNNNLKLGFIDRTGKLIIPFEYENVYPFTNGYAAVEKDGKYGFIDKKNNVVIPFEYDAAFGGEHSGLLAVGKDGKYGLVDKDNKVVVPLIFEDISEAIDGVIYAIYDGKVVIINLNEDSSSDWDKSANKTGCLNQVVKIETTGKTVKASAVRKKSQKFKLSGSAVSEITYKKTAGAKGIKVSSSGVVTLKKGLKKKTYKIKVVATAKDDGVHRSVSAKKTIKIVVK